MRRTLAVLALLATSWPHVMVLECALGLDPGGESHAAHTGPSERPDQQRLPHAHHGAHHASGAAAHHAGDPAAPRAERASGAPAGGQGCAMVMACGLVMMRSDGERVAPVEPETSGRSNARAVAAPIPVELSADTPPPRPSA